MRLGCHLSVAKGYQAAVQKAPQLGANAFQYFTKNPRGLRLAKAVDTPDAAAGKATLQELNLISIGHAPYLINLAAPDPGLYRASVEALVQDLVIAQARGSYAVVVHCGKPKDSPGEGFGRMQDALGEVLERYQGPVVLLLENTAGQGSEMGTTLEELLALAGPFPPARLGFCLDTQHAFASQLFPPSGPADFVGFSERAFMDRLLAIHLNDSKVPYGSRKDRHELIGQGYLGRDAIAALLTDTRLAGVPFFLETPVVREEQYADEIATCRALIASLPDSGQIG